MKYSLGIDIGTGSAKGILFSAGIRPEAQASAEYPTCFPRAGWAQQKPEDWWDAVIKVVRRILKESAVSAKDIGVISVSCQAPTVLLLDENGEPVYDALIWMDRRSEAECSWLEQKVGRERIFEITGTRLDPYYVYPELLWMKKNEPEAFRKAEILLQVNGYINYKLTGRYSLDPVHASHTQMYDVRKHCWSQELFDAIGVDIELFPPVYECTQKIGEVNEEAAFLTGLAEGTPVLCGTVDGAAAVLEAGVTGGGNAVEMTGTSSGLMIAFEDLKTAPNMAHQYSIVPGGHILYGAMSTTGASYKWFRDQLYDHERLLKDPYGQMEKEILREAPDPTELIFLPYMQGERCPVWDTNARGVFLGMNLGTTRTQMMRSVLEGVAFALRDNVEEAKKAGVSVSSLRSVGGCTGSLLWTKIKASVLNMPIAVPKQTMGAPGGLGIMNAVWLGEHATIQEAAAGIQTEMQIIQPEEEWIEHYQKMYEIYHSCYGDLKECFSAISRLNR